MLLILLYAVLYITLSQCDAESRMSCVILEALAPQLPNFGNNQFYWYFTQDLLQYSTEGPS